MSQREGGSRVTEIHAFCRCCFRPSDQQGVGTQLCTGPRGEPAIMHCGKQARGQSDVVVVQSLSRVRLFVTPWTAAHEASLSFTISQSLLKLMSIESVMPSNHLFFCHPLLLLASIFPSTKVFSKESAVHIRWPEYWSFNFSISPSNE